MSRRTRPQSIVDDKAFPVRVLIHPPKEGFGNQLNQLHNWLRDMIGAGDFAFHSGGIPGSVRDTIAIYFRNPHDAASLMYAFPDLELADGTILPGYTSPFLPYGRREKQQAD